ncbi:MAG: hypothetical protein MR548_08560, partial [Prevotella sp.]|nr:hypothetical protein [Prevotella sp.]
IGKVSKYTTLECRYTSKKQLKLVARSIKCQDDLFASTTERIKRQSLIIINTRVARNIDVHTPRSA